MLLILRCLAFVPETIIFGPGYAVMKFQIRSPTPLDPEAVWRSLSRRFTPLEDWVRLNYPPRFMRYIILWCFLQAAHRTGIAKHYDVSNDFYELFLDRKYLFYTCADYITGRETLEEAQANKVQFLLNLIDPQPGERIMELGCGWGGMLQEVFNRTGDRENLYGCTLSQEQFNYNQQHRGFQVEFKNFITEELPAEFYDKIYSIGVWEHVRPNDLRPTLAKLFRALKPGGKMVTHFFCGLDRRIPVAGVIGQIFFPGSATPPYPVQLREAQAAGFRVMHQSIHDTYRDTLRHWFERLVENKQRAIDLVGVQTYNKYLLFLAGSWRYFDDVQAILVRMVFQKPPIPDAVTTPPKNG